MAADLASRFNGFHAGSDEKTVETVQRHKEFYQPPG